MEFFVKAVCDTIYEHTSTVIDHLFWLHFPILTVLRRSILNTTEKYYNNINKLDNTNSMAIFQVQWG